MSLQLLTGSDFPKGHWILDGNSPHADYSGYERPATTSGTDRGPALVKGATRSLVVGNSTKVTFPSTIFKKGKEYLPFTIEAFVRPVVVDPTNTAEIQIIGNDGQMDGITIKGSVVSFVTKFTNTGEARASFDIMNLQVCAIDALHTATKNALYINGDLVSEVDITPAQQADTFASTGASLTSGTTSGTNKFMLNAVSFYEHALDEESIDAHFNTAQDNLTAEDIAIDYGGYLLEFTSEGPVAPYFRIEYNSNTEWGAGTNHNVSLHDGTLYPVISNGVSLAGYWETVVPLGTAPSAISAVNLLWEGSGADVLTSLDGTNWTTASKGLALTTVPRGTEPEGRFLWIRVSFVGGKVDDPSYMDNMTLALFITAATNTFAGREVVLSDAIPESDYDVIDFHQDWGAEMTTGSITIKAPVNNQGIIPKTIEVWVQRTGPTFTTSLSGANRVRTNGGTEQSTKMGEWQLRHFVFDAGFSGDIVLSGTAQVGHVILYPAALSDATIAEIYAGYVGKPKIQLDVDEVFDIHEFSGQVDIYEYDWAIESAG